MIFDFEQSDEHITDFDPDLNFYDQITEGNSLNSCRYYNINEINNCFYENIKSLKIVNYNVRSFNANFEQFYAIFTKVNPDILILCETWFNDYCMSEVENYFSYHIVRTSSNGRGGGVSIYIRNGIHSELLPDLSFCHDNLEICSVKFRYGNSEHVVLGIYRPHDNLTVFNELIGGIMDGVTLRSKSCFICGDFNVNICDDSGSTQEFINLMQSFNFRPCITKLTRFPTIESHSPFRSNMVKCI